MHARQPDSTPSQYRLTIRHLGPCGPRRPCWRPACRERFAGVASIETVAGVTLAHCHGSIYERGDPILARLSA